MACPSASRRTAGNTANRSRPVPARCCAAFFESLALLYRRTREQLERITGEPIRQLHIVGRWQPERAVEPVRRQRASGAGRGRSGGGDGRGQSACPGAGPRAAGFPGRGPARGAAVLPCDPLRARRRPPPGTPRTRGSPDCSPRPAPPAPDRGSARRTPGIGVMGQRCACWTHRLCRRTCQAARGRMWHRSVKCMA
jgi:hypothetical protein